MPKLPFERCVFVNCPFDEDYEPILQAILFCIVYLGFHPRISTERSDSLESRIEKIRDLIKDSKYSIHDLSRCQATEEGEYFRLNMPFELGIDYGCRQYFGRNRGEKRSLVLEEKRYRYHTVISDLSGFDIQYHEGDFEKAVRKVRNWLANESSEKAAGPSRILDAYGYFQKWHYERQRNAGFSDEDIQDYPTNELLEAMKEWIAEGRPV